MCQCTVFLPVMCLRVSDIKHIISVIGGMINACPVALSFLMKCFIDRLNTMGDTRKSMDILHFSVELTAIYEMCMFEV